MLGETELLTTSEILSFSHGLRLHQQRKIDTNTYRQVHRRLSEMGAVRTGRAATIGRPWRWTLPADMLSADGQDNE